MKNFGALRAIVTAGLIVGVMDISSAFAIWLERGVGLQRGLQGIAAGLLGTKSYEGGMATAGMGLAIHFLVAFVVVSIFYVVSRRVPYFTGFMLVLLSYIWCDEYWMAAYNVPDYQEAARDIPRIVRFHFASVILGIVLIAAAIVYRKFIAGVSQGFPWYFFYLVCASLI